MFDETANFRNLPAAVEPPPLAENRVILHMDLDAFFCAVEERYDSDLIGVAFAIGGSAEGRGVISTCSYAARQFGVRSAMPTAQALRLCPSLLLLPVRHGVYGNVSRRVMALVRDLSPMVEQISIDEAFVDLSGIVGSLQEAEPIARRLQYRIRKELGLPASIGIATSKLVAKMATEEGKAAAKRRGEWDRPPCGFVVVSAGEEAAFLAPQDISALWGVGPKMAQKLRELQINTIGELAAHDRNELVRRWGKWGADLSRRARGVDNRPIVPFREAKSISKETTFARDTGDRAALVAALGELSAGVSERLTQKGLSGNVVKLKVRWPDFTLATRQTMLPSRTTSAALIRDAAIVLMDKIRPTTQPVRLIGVGVSGLESKDGSANLKAATDAGQLPLFDLDEL